LIHFPNQKEDIWKTRKSLVKIAEVNSFGQLVNKSSTNKKVLKTNLQDAQHAVEQENNKEDFNFQKKV
jgi:hypothetical protein